MRHGWRTGKRVQQAQHFALLRVTPRAACAPKHRNENGGEEGEHGCVCQRQQRNRQVEGGDGEEAQHPAQNEQPATPAAREAGRSA